MSIAARRWRSPPRLKTAGRSATSLSSSRREARIGWINHLAVAAGLRSQGLGRRLLEHALDRFRAEGMTIAQIETLEQNAIGRHLFPALGFREVARKMYYALSLEGASVHDEGVSDDGTRG